MQTKDEIVAALTDPNLDELAFGILASETWRISPAQIEKLLATKLQTGYGSLSLKAIGRFLPHLKKGLIYSTLKPEDSALHAAGYPRRDQFKKRLCDLCTSAFQNFDLNGFISTGRVRN